MLRLSGDSAVKHAKFGTFGYFRIVLDCEWLVFLLMRGHHVDRVDEGGGRGSLPEGFRVDQRRHLHLVGALPLHFILLGVG